jgi:hypothetical protein
MMVNNRERGRCDATTKDGQAKMTDENETLHWKTSHYAAEYDSEV